MTQTSDELWGSLYKAGEAEYDRFWRMPLDEDFGPQIYRSNADLCNTGGKPGGSCTAALFLKASILSYSL
jgi:cytosol aminopeptidase